MVHPFRQLVLGLLVWGAGAAPHDASAQRLSEHDVKAAFLINFARFTEWPDGAFSATSLSFVVGIAGDELLRRAVDGLGRGKAVGGRALETRHVKDVADLAGIQILYVGSAAASRVEDLLKALHGQAVLTVGDGLRFCDQGGMIKFLLEDNRVRFEIRIDATERAGLKVSSRVLTLARTVHRKS